MSVIPPYEAQIDYYEHLSESLPMPLIQWKAFKGVFYATLMATVSIAMSMLPHGSWMQLAVFAATLLIIFGVEFEEVQIANFLTVTFDGTGDSTDENEDDDA